VNKLLLISSLAAMIILPIRAARLKSAERGLRRAIVTTFAFNIAWGVVVMGIFIVLLKIDPQRLYPHIVNGP
jgi:hypothetical protein